MYSLLSISDPCYSNIHFHSPIYIYICIYIREEVRYPFPYIVAHMENKHQKSVSRTEGESKQPPSYSSHNFQSRLTSSEVPLSNEGKWPSSASSAFPGGEASSRSLFREMINFSLGSGYESVNFSDICDKFR